MDPETRLALVSLASTLAILGIIAAGVAVALVAT